MVTFDGAVNGAKKAFDTAAGKTGEALELSRLYVRKAQLKNRIRTLYGRLGKATYNTNRSICDEAALMDKLMEEIDRQKDALRNTEHEIQEASSFNCHVCGKKNSPRADACRACGAVLNPENKPPSEEIDIIDTDFRDE